MITLPFLVPKPRTAFIKQGSNGEKEGEVLNTSLSIASSFPRSSQADQLRRRENPLYDAIPSQI
jgi:hypothetical protein